MRIAIAVAALLSVVACGAGEDEKAYTEFTDAVAATPNCADVWVVGETLPEDYEGCRDDDDVLQLSAYYTCDDGTKLTGYDDRLYAVMGSEIRDHNDNGYVRAFAACKSN